ncbi:zinc ribbon domain-containing protein [Planococcus sp. MERTA32b]|nr:zinc ribbon domain-containing protein [Planococcus sp. MER TA 32b]
MSLNLILGVFSLLIPILSGIAIRKIIKNESYIIYKKVLVVLTSALIVNYINLFLFGIGEEIDAAIKFGLFIALISITILNKRLVIEKKMNDLSTFLAIKKNIVQTRTRSNLRDSQNNINSTFKTVTDDSSINVNYCPSCGLKAESTASFCKNCGNNLSDKKVSSNDNNQSVPLMNIQILRGKFNHPFIEQSFSRMNNIARKNPIVTILVAIFITIFLMSVLEDSPEEAAQKAYANTEESALDAAEKSVENQIEVDGFKFVDVKDMEATMTREENVNTQQSGIFKVSGTAILKDTEGKKHEDIPFQLYIDFYQGNYYAQQMVDIRYGSLIEQLW